MRREIGAPHVVGGRWVGFGSGVRVAAPGPVREVRDFGSIVVVLTEWLGRAGAGPRRTVRGNNLYAYAPDGRQVWQVRAPDGATRPLLLTGFLDDATGLELHEAEGWWVTVDPTTGRCVRAQRIA